MSCNCTPTKKIPYYADTLAVGTVTANTDYHVYIQRDKRLQRYDATSDADGLLLVDLSAKDKNYLSPYASFVLHVRDTDGTKVTVTLPDASTGTDFCLDVVKQYEEDELLDTLTATLEAL